MSKQRTTERIKWIRTLDELPDEGVIVLMHGEFNICFVWIGYVDEVTANGCIWRTAGGAEIDGVTHWAEMPCGPVMSSEVGK
jgi:hypothetical protein